jgi:fatty acid amide hydrolase
MAAPTTLTELSAAHLARLITQGDVSASAAVEAHIARIEQVNPAINAVVVKRYDVARREAQAADDLCARGEPLGPLHGVPITVKECFDLAGTPATLGTPSRKRDIATTDDGYVQTLRSAGAIILGKTNLPQACIYNESVNAVYGRTRNPWNLARTCGGSSGGQAAIIAAGGSPVGLGSDVAGSLRLPAHFCGIASLKPTAERSYDHSYSRFLPPGLPIVSVAGPMARDVNDLALMMQVLDRKHPLPDVSKVDVAKLRVGYFTGDGIFAPSPSVLRAVHEAVAVLRERGASCTSWQPPDVKGALDCFVRLLTLNQVAAVRNIIGRDRPVQQIAALLFVAQRSRRTIGAVHGLLKNLGQRALAEQIGNFGYTTADLPDLIQDRQEYVHLLQTSLDQAEGGPLDVILCPPCALPAYPHGESTYLAGGGAYTSLWNFTGYPAGVVPVTRVREDGVISRPQSLDVVDAAARKVDKDSVGLPIGVQVVARPWQEHIALVAMQAIQDALRSREDYPATPI